MIRLRLIPAIILSIPLTAPGLFSQRESRADQDALQQEEKENYYRKWMEEDVVYIINNEEKAVFEKLSTLEEKDQFIEQFWLRRDPNPSTIENEFKEEHYRRIAYANDNFKSGIAGWKTDRGRIYILFGKPDQIEAMPTGGNYERQPHEGGGFTSVYPFERWWYRHLEGVGSDIELEFVDPRFSNEYYLAVNPEEKDALLHVPGQGLTWAEEFGLADKKDRPYFVSNTGQPYPWINYRAKDSPFQRYETYFKVQAPVTVKYKDLKQVVETNVTYDTLPFQVRQDYFRLNDQQMLVPVTLQFQNKDLTFKEEGGLYSIKLAVYGIVTSITNRIIQEFEDEVAATYRPEELEQGRLERSMYQKILPLQHKMRYKIDLVIKDLNSGKMGVLRQALVPPAYEAEKLTLSAPVLSGFIRQLQELPKQEQMFVLGDIWIRPSVDRTFLAHDPLGIYVHVYNAGFDQSRQAPSLKVSYRITDSSGAVQREVVDENGESIQLASGQRVVLIKGIPLKDLGAGDYRLNIRVEDQVTGQDAAATSEFQIVGQLQASR